MQWEGREESENVEDQRGYSKKTVGLALGGGGVVIVVIAMLLGVDPAKLADMFGGGNAPPQGQNNGPVLPGKQGNGQAAPKDPAEERQARFSKVVFHDTEVVWDEQFRRMGRQYQKPTLVLFTDQVSS